MLKSQADLLEESIQQLEKDPGPDSRILGHLRAQLSSQRRQERVRAGLERPRPNPCG